MLVASRCRCLMFSVKIETTYGCTVEICCRMKTDVDLILIVSTANIWLVSTADIWLVSRHASEDIYIMS